MSTKDNYSTSSALPQEENGPDICDFEDEYGQLRYQEVRYPGKEIRYRRPDGNGGWIWNLDGVERLLYSLPTLLAAPLDEPVFFVEGARKAKRLISLGLIATSSGSATSWKSKPSLIDPFEKRQVILIPDNDQSGEKYGQDVATDLVIVAASVKILRLPNLPLKGDILDWLDNGGTKDDLLILAKYAEPFPPSDASSNAKGRKKKKGSPKNPTLREVLKRLTNVKESGNGWVASCPARSHGQGNGDEEQSLSIGEGEGGKVLLNCFAGCDTEAIVEAMDLKMADLFLPRDEGEDEETLLAELNSKHAVVTIEGKTRVLNKAQDSQNERKRVTFSTFRDFRELYSNRHTRGGCPAGSWWLTHPKREGYTDVVFAPGQETPGAYNLWGGFAVPPKQGNCDKFLAHVRDNICNGDDYLNRWVLAWSARLVQQLQTKTGTALVLRGKQGTGKGIFATALGSLLGRHFKHVSNPRHVVGNFNAHLEDTLLLFVDEGFWAGDKTAEGALKTLVTEPTLRIERKGIESTEAKNYVRLIIASNEDWVVPAGGEERRFAVLDVADTKKQDRAYFSAITEELNNGGREALLDYLLNLNLADYPDPAVIPKTTALLDQKLLSLPPVAKWWYEKLLDGQQTSDVEGWADWTLTTSIYLNFSATPGLGDKQKHIVANAFGRLLKDLVPGLDTQKRTNQNGKRVNGYIFPPLLECRRAFEERLGQKINWPPDAKGEEKSVPVQVISNVSGLFSETRTQ